METESEFLDRWNGKGYYSIDGGVYPNTRPLDISDDGTRRVCINNHFVRCYSTKEECVKKSIAHHQECIARLKEIAPENI